MFFSMHISMEHWNASAFVGVSRGGIWSKFINKR